MKATKYARVAGNSRSSSNAPDRWLTSVTAEVRSYAPVATLGALIRFQRWLRRLAGGYDVDIRTPFFAQKEKDVLVYKSRDAIVKGFEAHIKASNSLRQQNRYVCDYVDAVELEHIEKIGPMSPYLPWFEDGPRKVLDVFRDKKPLAMMKADILEKAKDRLTNMIRVNSIGAVSLDVVINGTPGKVGDDSDAADTTTNSGHPWFISPWKPTSAMKQSDKTAEIVAAFEWYTQETRRLTKLLNRPMRMSELPYWYAMAGQRIVQKGPKPFDPKSKRIVEAYPKHEMLLGKQFVLPITDALREVKLGSVHIMSGWFDLPTVDTAMQTMLVHAANNKRIVLSGDVQNFDATVPPYLLMHVIDVLSRWVKPELKWLVLNHGSMMVNRTRLITPSGVTPPGPTSMKSGSVLTSLVGSLANLLILLYGSELGLYTIDHVCVLGDDFVIDGAGVSPLNVGASYEAFGMTAHPDKQYYKPNSLQFLKRLHIGGYPGGIASVYRTLGSILSLEKLQGKLGDEGKYAFILQALSKLQNAAFNPYFEVLVNYVKQGDKFKLGEQMSPSELAQKAGQSGELVMKDLKFSPWKRHGAGMEFVNWAVHGVIRGEKLPPLGKARFERVYGKKN